MQKKLKMKMSSLNDPFAGNEGNNSMSSNIPEDEQDNELSLYNFKLAINFW